MINLRCVDEVMATTVVVVAVFGTLAVVVGGTSSIEVGQTGSEMEQTWRPLWFDVMVTVPPVGKVLLGAL